METALTLPKNYLDPAANKPASTLKIVGNFSPPAAPATPLPGTTAPATPAAPSTPATPAVNTTDPMVRNPITGGLEDNKNYQPSGLAARYSATPGAVTPLDPVAKAREDLAKQLGEATTPLSEQEIRKQMESDSQAYIDAVNKRYDALNAQDEQAGNVRVDQTRSFNIRSGNIGSDFATAETEATKGANRKIIDANNAMRNTELAAIYSKINSGAREEAQNAKKLALANADQRIKVLDEQKAASLAQVTDAAKKGLPFDSLKNTNLDTGETVFDYLRRTTGKSPFELEYLYNQNLPANQQRTYEYKTIGDKAYAFSINPATKKPELQDLGVAVPPDYQFTVAPDGTPLVYNKVNGTAQIAPGFKEGQFAKPVAATPNQLNNADYQKAQKFIADNPNAKPQELEQYIRANTALSDGDIKSLVGTKTVLTKDYLKGILTADQLASAAKEAGFTKEGSGFLGIGKDADTEKYLDSIMSTIQAYKDAGYTDEQILSKMQTQ